MPVAALALLLTAAAAHAGWNFAAKGARSSLPFIFAFALVSEVVYLPLAIGAYLWIRPDFGWEALLFVSVSGLLNIGYFVLLAEGYRWGDLSIVYPLARGSGPAIAVVGAIALFGERPTPLALAGAFTITAGVVAMSWAPSGASGPRIGRSVAFALATGLVIATYTLWDSRGIDFVPPVLYVYGLDLARLTLLAPYVLGSVAGRDEVVCAFREQPRAVAAIGVLSPAAYILVLAALSLAPVSYVAPAREISILFVAALGVGLLGESDAARRLLGAAAIVAGVIALAVG